MKKQLIWVLEWKKSVHYWWSYILFAPEGKELTCMLDPLLYRWGVPPVVIRCVHWTMQSGVLQTWISIHCSVVIMCYLFDMPLTCGSILLACTTAKVHTFAFEFDLVMDLMAIFSNKQAEVSTGEKPYDTTVYKVWKHVAWSKHAVKSWLYV